MKRFFLYTFDFTLFTAAFSGAGLPGSLSKWVPPDPIPNSEVKLLSADDSVGSPHVKVGHCQALKIKTPPHRGGVFILEPFSGLPEHGNACDKFAGSEFEQLNVVKLAPKGWSPWMGGIK